MSGRNNKNTIVALLFTDIIKENIEDSSSSSDDELEIEICRRLNRTGVPRIRCRNYVEDIVSAYSDAEFKTHFR